MSSKLSYGVIFKYHFMPVASANLLGFLLFDVVGTTRKPSASSAQPLDQVKVVRVAFLAIYQLVINAVGISFLCVLELYTLRHNVTGILNSRNMRRAIEI